MTTYDSNFFEYVNSGAIGSAEQILPLLLSELEITSVLDVGCGLGAWLSVWNKLGTEDIKGLDGDYVNRDQLLISKDSFIPCCLSKEFNLQRRFDLVQSLEVGEHLSKESAALFVGSIVNHGDLILFSAAPKGQGGDEHVNEQDYEYWRCLFAMHDYVAIDYLRPLIINNKRIEPWYRYNLFLYVSAERIEDLPDKIKKFRMHDREPLRDISPLLYKIRKKFVCILSVAMMTRLAKIKEFIITRIRI